MGRCRQKSVPSLMGNYKDLSLMENGRTSRNWKVIQNQKQLQELEYLVALEQPGGLISCCSSRSTTNELSLSPVHRAVSSSPGLSPGTHAPVAHASPCLQLPSLQVSNLSFSLIFHSDSSGERIQVAPFILSVFARCDICVKPPQRLAAHGSGVYTQTSYLGGRVT